VTIWKAINARFVGIMISVETIGVEIEIMAMDTVFLSIPSFQ
jgi:hypothetical protein